MVGTMAGRSRRSGGTLCVVLIVLFAFIMDDVLASSEGNASTSPNTGDGSDGLSDGTTMEKGMKPFFDMVKNFLGVVQPHKLTEQTWLNLSTLVSDSGSFQTDEFKDWKNWATYLIGFCVCAAIGILFFIVMPFVGLIFCCCRCAGKCGGRHKPHDPKRAGCKRKTYCTVLLVLNTVTLAGVVCAFLSNELVYQKLTNQDNIGPVGKLTSAIGHLEGYINDTVDEVQTTLLRQFDNSRASIEDDIRNTANNAVDEVLKTLNATALLDQTKKLSQDVNRTQDNLKNVAAQLSFLSSEGRALTDNLTEIADGAAAAITRVTGDPDYGNFKRDQYVVTADFSGLDQLSTETAQIEQSLDMNKYIVQAENAVADTKNQTTSSVNTKIDEASSSIDSVRAEIDKGADSVRDSLKPVIDGMQSTSAKLKGAQPDISEYSKYGWYGGLAVSCLLLLVVVVYYLGVLFGLCGERPGLGAQCCNTGTGANFLMAGVGFTFIFAWLIMLVCVILFVVGGPAYTEVCRYFDDHSPQELKPFETALLKASDLTKDIYNGKDVDLSITGILDDCFHDKPIYGVMKLDNMVNLTAITDLEPLEVKLDDLKNAGLKIPDIQIVSAQLNQTVENFANSSLVTLNFTPYYTEVNKNLTMGDLTQMSQNLRSIANHGTFDNSPSERQQLITYSDRLKELEDNSVALMRAAVTSLNQSLTYLDGQRLGLKSKVNALLEGLQRSENNFNAQKNDSVTGQLETVVNRVIAQAQGIVNDILNTVRNDLGKCRPIYDGFYAATDAGCVVVLDPLNGFWFSVGWCLFFFIPSLIFAVKLAGLYRREHDEKDFDDPNYILYGRNHDTIPLTSREHARPAAPYPGMANSAYRQDSYMGPGDKYAPPPYGASHNGMGSVATSNGSQGDGSKQYYNY